MSYYLFPSCCSSDASVIHLWLLMLLCRAVRKSSGLWITIRSLRDSQAVPSTVSFSAFHHRQFLSGERLRSFHQQSIMVRTPEIIKWSSNYSKAGDTEMDKVTLTNSVSPTWWTHSSYTREKIKSLLQLYGLASNGLAFWDRQFSRFVTFRINWIALDAEEPAKDVNPIYSASFVCARTLNWQPLSTKPHSTHNSFAFHPVSSSHSCAASTFYKTEIPTRLPYTKDVDDCGMYSWPTHCRAHYFVNVIRDVC